METIVTPVTVITLDSTRIVHSIKADLVARYFPPVVRLVQYDQSLPVIAVSLMQNGQAYTLPSGAAANIRVHKPDSTYVYNPALGCDSTRKIVYFEVTQAMAAANGDGLAIVEIVVDGDIAGTSLVTLHFEENPVPEDAIESSDEWETIYELGERIIASTVTPVSTAAGMTDHNVVYLYTGTESGWNQGHMYYYNGTTWVDAGIAVTDTTLSVAGLAADAKATGDEITSLKEDSNYTNDSIGINVFLDTFEYGGFDGNGINTDSGTARGRSKGYTKVNPSTTYNLIADVPSGYYFSISYYRSNDFTTARLSATPWSSTIPSTFTTSAETEYIRILFKNGTEESASVDLSKLNTVHVENIHSYTTVNDAITNLINSVDGYYKYIDTKCNEYFHSLNWSNYTLDTTTTPYTWGYNIKRATVRSILSVPYDIRISSTGTYMFSVRYMYNDTDLTAENVKSTSGWVTDYYVPSGVPFIIIIKNNEQNISVPSDIANITFAYCMMIKRTNINYGAYTYYGEKIGLAQKHTYNFERITTEEPVYSDVLGGCQDSDVYDDKYFQLHTNGYIRIISKLNGAELARLKCAFGHGNSCQFSNEKYESSDKYPMMYISDYNEPKLHLVRITDESATIVKTYTWSASDIGYRCDFAVDSVKKVAYGIGYAVDSSVESNNNYMRMTKWDISGNTPNLIGRYDMPFIMATQGCKYFDNKIFLVSSFIDPYVPTAIYVIDPFREKIVTVLNSFPDFIFYQTEMEGCMFYKASSGDYDLILRDSYMRSFKINTVP